MTSPAIAEFRILHLRPATTVEEDGTAVHKMWEEAITDLKKADGCKRVFFGRKVEDPSAGVLCVEWASLAASKNHTSTSKLFTAELNAGVVHDQKAYHATLLGLASEVDAVFAAPTTEVFTAFGAEPGCLDTVREFVAKVLADRPEGCLGAMAGRVEEEISKQGGIAEEKGPAVVMMIGWEGVEEHMKAKGREDGVLLANIHLLRVLRKEVEMYHVSLEEL